MKIRFNRLTKTITFLDNTTTLNANDVMWHTLDVEMEGGDLLPNESLWVTFDNGNGISTQGDMTPRVGVYHIPDAVLAVEGEWTLQLLIKVYDADRGHFVQRGASNPATFTVGEALHFDDDNNPITNNTAGSLRTDISHAQDRIQEIDQHVQDLEDETRAGLFNLDVQIPYVLDDDYHFLPVTYEEIREGQIFSLEGFSKKAKVGDSFVMIAFTSDKYIVDVRLEVVETDEGYIRKVKSIGFMRFREEDTVNELVRLKEEDAITQMLINRADDRIDRLEERHNDLGVTVTFDGHSIPVNIKPVYWSEEGGAPYGYYNSTVGTTERLATSFFNRTPLVGTVFKNVTKTVDGYIVVDVCKVNSIDDTTDEVVFTHEKLIVLYSPEELNAIKSRLDSFSLYEIVSSLPASGDANKLYLKPSSGQEEGNILEEWLWVNNKWEMVGTKKVEIDLTPYAKKDEVISLSQKGVANGVASLDANGKVPEEQLPDDIGGGIYEEALKDYVKFTDYATVDKAGVVKVNQNNSGMRVVDGVLKLYPCSPAALTLRQQTGVNYNETAPITAGNVNEAVKAALTDEKHIVLEPEDKAAACETIGAATQKYVNDNKGTKLYKHITKTSYGDLVFITDTPDKMYTPYATPGGDVLSVNYEFVNKSIRIYFIKNNHVEPVLMISKSEMYNEFDASVLTGAGIMPLRFESDVSNLNDNYIVEVM